VSGSKLIYLARRNPRLSREQFMRRWRQHAAFSMGLARWSAIQRCAYCDVLPPSPGIPWAVEGYDGIADIWFRGDAAPADPEDRARLSADEIETFSDYVSAFALHTREVIVKPGGGTVKATLFVRNTEPGGPGGFAARWARHADRALSLPRADLVRGYTRNTADRTGEWGNAKLPFDGVAEYWFETVEGVSEFFADPQVWEMYAGGVERYGAGSSNLFVVTNEVVMYDRALAE
jgi:hypothetical protein